jgi:flagellar motor protein MotB
MAACAAAVCSSAVRAQDTKTGKLQVSVDPPQAYTFVDGQAIGPHSRTIRLSPGDHSVIVANYGYQFLRQHVSIEPGHTTTLDAKLQASGADVSGPRGRIQIEVGTQVAGDTAVLLNGKKPDYFVGHVDEFNNDIGWKQELIVPPGSHEVTVTRRNRVIWSGTVPVEPNKRVIVTISHGKQKTKDWPRGAELQAMHRFTAGVASASIVIAPVSATISATPPKIDCSQPSDLKWASAETIDGDISHMSPVPPSGEQTVSPKQTTQYDFSATGPGGTARASTTVEVNRTVTANLDASQVEGTYQKIGDKVLKQESATLNWSASNTDSVSLDPFGTVNREGSRMVDLTPTKTSDGPVDETTTYTLRATNVCGGSETKSISLHLTGAIEPIPGVILNSVFFPTDYPDPRDPTVGLVRSQKEALASFADGFKQYLRYDPDAKIAVAAHADERGPKNYNQSLSERRGQAVKDYLVASGIPIDKIEVSSHGEDQPLDQSTVDDLQKNNPSQPSDEQVKFKRTSWLAYNRRVDVVLLPQNKESSQFYPNGRPDLMILWQRPKPDEPAVTAVQ